ncbi:hypothetical protein DH2020_029403 [Rehmannia glutinosa]|uniref:Uncharacterized protein n=1 Tax=Rehmannia glutinosa TaxID=99300 RepID=A0ABR0VQE4_REHGL
MVSDSQLVNRLQEILRASDLETTTAAGVRRRLEEEFFVDLYGRRAFVREQIDLFLHGRAAQDDGAEQEEEVDENAQNDAVEEEQRQRESGSDNEGALMEQPKKPPVTTVLNSVANLAEHHLLRRTPAKKGGPEGCSGVPTPTLNMNTDVKKKGRGFSKPCALSPQLQEFFGVSELARTEVVKKLWEYIREQNLQNPKNRRKILCDESLHGIFRVKSIDMFQMNKALSKHIWPLDELAATPVKSSQRERQHKQGREEATPVKSSQRERQRKQGKEEGSEEPKRKEKPKKGGGSGLTAPLPLSDALVKFVGTGEHELSRADVVKRMWQYIKENELQDPSDKRMVLCDDKLKELFGVDSFHGFTVSKLLTSHFIKTQG